MTQDKDHPRGLAFAVTAYFLWGFLPLYMKALAHVPVLEVLAHRVIWSVPVALGVLVWLGRTGELLRAFRTPRMLGMAVITATLIAVNWGIYVWAIQNGQALEAALGYYINPLFSVMVGWAVLGEKLDRWQWAAIALAALAVAVLTLEAGRLPIVALALTLTWGAYAFAKKMLPIGPNQGFALEVLILVPIALGYMAWLGPQAAIWSGSTATQILLLSAGIVTAVPLMIYANGAKLLRLSTIGILQYIAPTMIFLTAVFVFGEAFSQAKALAFPLIWAALAIYSWRLIRKARATPQAAG